jgi:hypothetical protein
MRLGKQRGRKRILAPDGSELTLPTKPQSDGVLVKALARAWRWQRLLDRGVYGSVTEIAEAEKISKSYISRILRLALLAPDLVEAILGGWADQRLMLEKLERPLAVAWEEQRRAVAGLSSATAKRKELRSPSPSCSHLACDRGSNVTRERSPPSRADNKNAQQDVSTRTATIPHCN